ncbi:hypothetical protein VTJ83DRAFT_7382 [Remersonia thermophila]|uniref:Uncharacterized protein n=1 Tax=Remersonia thermophila TaxID=72144 RepID=A0ABR4D5P5_9PEZI
MAGVINDFTLNHKAELREQRKKYHKHIRGLEKRLGEASNAITEQNSCIETQNHDISALRESGKQLTVQLEKMEAKLGESESRIRTMEQKYRACKTHLNAAIKEQQTLYKSSKERCEQAIKQMQEMERSHREEAESAVQKAEAIREQMTERLRQTIAQNKAEAAELYETIENLTTQLAEKEADLNQEREHVHLLSEKLEALKESSEGFQELAVQGKEILKKLEEQQSEAEERHRRSAEALRDNRLDGLAEMMSRQPKDLDGLRRVQEESFNTVTSKVDEILALQTGFKEATDQLSSNIDNHMEKIWKQLDDQLESLSRQLAEKAEENGMMTTLYQRKEDECQQHAKEVASLRDVAKGQADQIQELEKSLEICDFLQQENEELAQRAESLDTETAQLKEEVQSKTTALAELRARLDAAETAHAAEVRNYKSSLQTLTQALHEHTRGSEQAIQQAVEKARLEARDAIEQAQKEAEKALQGSQHERDSLLENLEEELKTAQDHMKELDDEARRERARAEALVIGLERWVGQERQKAEGLSFLKDYSKGAEDISKGLTQVLGEPSLSQRSNTKLSSESRLEESFQENAVTSSSGSPQNVTSSGLSGFQQGGSKELLAKSREQGAVNEMTPTGPLQFVSALDHLRKVVVRSPANWKRA